MSKTKKSKSIEELTKGFEEFEKTHETKEVTKEDFEKNLKKVTQKGDSKDNEKPED